MDVKFHALMINKQDVKINRSVLAFKNEAVNGIESWVGGRGQLGILLFLFNGAGLHSLICHFKFHFNQLIIGFLTMTECYVR